MKPHTIHQYKVIEKLGKSLFAEVFKVCPNNQPEQMLVLKRIKPSISLKNNFDLLKSQIKYVKDLDISGLIKPDFYFFEQEELFIIQKYFDGITLGKWIKSQKRTTLTDFFKIACAITTVLENMHKAGYFHGGIKPNNILVMPNTFNSAFDIQLIDPVRVINPSEVSRYIYDNDFRTNTLFYVSPEQTEIMKRHINYTINHTTDFYSLGTLFYELLSGTAPFSSKDPLEVIHSHIADYPASLNKTGWEIPEMIDKIIFKLMAKAPEKRYQTANALLHDLNLCQVNYKKNGRIKTFNLGITDTLNRITIPSVMIGRDREKKLLLNEYSKSRSGSFCSAIISGLPGIGKTRLIEELQIPIISTGGYFASGKFDLYQKNIPYSSLVQAFNNLIRIFLIEDEKRLTAWKDTICRALEPNTKLLTDFVPDLEKLLGKQPDIELLPPVESKIRFHNAVEKFISSIAGHNHPITLFIDDLQWCDTATFEIIENLFINADNHPYLFFIGALRHNEVDFIHPMTQLMLKLKKKDKPPIELQINELNPNKCNEMTACILNSSFEKTRELSGIISSITDGNPLYINESLSWMHKASLINMDNENIWQWDINTIKSANIPKSIVSLFLDKVTKMPQKTQQILQIAACLGSYFTLEKMSIITDKSCGTLYNDFAPALRMRIIVNKKDHMAFFHDRVHEAVLSSLDPEKKFLIHSNIAESLLKNVPEKDDLKNADNLPEIAHHLNLGNLGKKSCIDIKEQYRDAAINFHAAQKAISLLAIDMANKFYNVSNNLLPKDCWKHDYNLTFSIKKNLVLSDFAQGKSKKAENMLNEVLANTENNLDHAEILVEQAVFYSSLGQFEKSLQAGRKALLIFGIDIPVDLKSVKKKMGKLKNKIKIHLLKKSSYIEKNEKKTSIILRCYIEIITSYYMLGHLEHYFLTGLMAVADFGQSKTRSTQSLLSCPLTVASSAFKFDNQHELSEKLEKKALETCTAYPNIFPTGRGYISLAWLTQHWSKSPHDILKTVMAASESTSNCGDLFFHGMSHIILIWTYFTLGNDFKLMESIATKGLEFANKFNLFFISNMLTGFYCNIIEPFKTDCRKSDISQKIKLWKKTGDYAILANYYIHKAYSCYFLNDQQNCYKALVDAKKYIKGLASTIPERLWHIIFVLNSLKQYETKHDPAKKNKILATFKPALEKLEYWAEFGPILKPYLFFIQAEKTKVFRGFKAAKNLYLDAIDAAAEHGYVLLEGHIHESFGILLLKHKSRQGRLYINEAANLYEKCHAKAKLKHIQEKYPHYFPMSSRETNDFPVNSLDIAYLTKAITAIFQDIAPDKLLQTTLVSIMEKTGAGNGVIIIEEKGQFFIRTRATKSQSIRAFSTKETLSSQPYISQAIIRYAVRTKKTLLLDNAGKKGNFINDAEVKKKKLKSVLCLPVIYQQKLLAVLYLENSMLESLFLNNDIKLLELTSYMAAISLNNVMLLESLKEKKYILENKEERFKKSLKLAKLSQWEYDWKIDKNLWAEETYKLFDGCDLNKIASTFEEYKDILHPDDREFAANAFIDSVNNNAHFNFVYRLLLNNKTIKHVNSIGSTQYDKKGKPLRSWGSLQDITEQKQVEKKLAESESKYRCMMEAISDMVYICSSEFYIEYMNPAMIKKTGRNATGEICHKTIFKNDNKCKWCVFDQIQEGKHVEYEMFDPKESRYYSATSSPVAHFDAANSNLTILRDITEIKEIKNQLQQSLKMESIGTLTGGVAHDFNNILSIIIGNTELALNVIPQWHPASSNLKKIKTATMRAANIVKQLLNFSRKTNLELKPIEIIPIINNALEFLRSSIPTTIDFRKNIQITDGTILADPVQMNQIMMNLCINASQAMEQTGGIITISMEKIVSDKKSTDNFCNLTKKEYVQITVSDTGPGIDPEIIDRIFDPYFTTKEIGKGSGMGLAVVHGIVKNHNGTISVKSKPCKGSTFTILLPSVEEKAEIKTKTAEKLCLGNEKILFVDDEQFIINIVQDMLEHLGYQIETKKNPLEALELFRLKSDQFDLVITDMTMPHMTGARLSEKLMEIRPDIPVIICTGHSSMINAEKAKQLGIAEYVMKPFTMQEIAKTIRKAIDNQKCLV